MTIGKHASSWTSAGMKIHTLSDLFSCGVLEWVSSLKNFGCLKLDKTMFRRTCRLQSFNTFIHKYVSRIVHQLALTTADGFCITLELLTVSSKCLLNCIIQQYWSDTATLGSWIWMPLADSVRRVQGVCLGNFKQKIEDL